MSGSKRFIRHSWGIRHLLCTVFICAFVSGGMILPARAETDVYPVDSDEANLLVSLAPGQKVDLKCKVEEGQKTWVLMEFPSAFSGMQFARPADEYCISRDHYLFLFSRNGQLTQNAPNLFYTASSDVSKINFGVNDLSGLDEVIITTRKGELPRELQDIQKITLKKADKIQVAQSDKTRNAAPDIEPSELTELVNGNNAFAFDLYGAIREGNDNLFYSPYSISLALAMTYAGAGSETQKQMANALHFTLSQERLHPAFNALDLELARRGEGAKGQNGEGFRLNIANALWGQTGHSFHQEFLDTLAMNYGAGLKLLDFRSAPEDSRVVINEWVSDRTEGKIQDLIPPNVITSLTRLILTNAIYFNAAWNSPFREERTQNGTFHLLDGSQITVPLMSQTSSFRYFREEGVQAVELPYDGKELSMVILLPDTGRFREIEGSLTAQHFSTVVKGLEPGNVELTMPKFTYTSDSIKLKETLSAMGMPIAFTGDADFSGIDGTTDLRIDDVIHKAFVSVDEKGTEAAAATAVVIGVTSAPLETLKMTIDRPFIFLIRDIKTEAILFVGRVLNPKT